MKTEEYIQKGQFTFDSITEDDKSLIFNPPLVIYWSVWKEEDLSVYVDYDFGLTDRFSPYKSINNGWRYNNISKETPLEEIVKAFVQYDLFHAFCHCNFDPNYSHLHWALYGNLKNRVEVFLYE